MTAEFTATLRNLADTSGLRLTQEKLEKMAAFYAMLEEANRNVNLTAPSSAAETAERHFLDSLARPALELLPRSGRVVDVGAGAGFPGLPIAILRDDLSVVLLDSIGKKTAFLESVVKSLGLVHVAVVTARAEDYARSVERETFDAALSRAVAPLNVLLEYTLPFVRVGGAVLAWKGPAADDELRAAARASCLLGGGDARLYPYRMPGRGGFSIVEVKKTRPTPKEYPRKAGKPASDPIV